MKAYPTYPSDIFEQECSEFHLKSMLQSVFEQIFGLVSFVAINSRYDFRCKLGTRFRCSQRRNKRLKA